MKNLTFIISFLLFPFLLLAQQPVLQAPSPSSALKPWMNRYLSPNQNLTINFPFRKNNPLVFSSKSSYSRIENRNQDDQQKLSPYLNKVYLQQMHLRSTSDLSKIANETNFYDPKNNLINRAWSYFIRQGWKK